MLTEVLVKNTEKLYAQKITARNHQLVADEPEKLKGDNEGPTPFEYLLSAIGSCTSITLKMYAEKKGIQVDNISVRLNYIPPNALEGTSSRITRKIHIEGDFSDEQHKRMLEIADRCPVHRTLREGMDIMSSLE